ncbi:MAG: Aspartate carbamoyltransferase [Candidatus Carbobacillus altaicus]|uniref:Aspartate carbamoyltransferase n=1 Tax=Candidatus Carbonibacillus altaicus TaxID=2163959 RepID=A0A2R6Y325_9BACL|nr:MAG: Aspartate carbamoyltransferase [Candidatus Carbobacillus altaicus]
MTDIAFRSLNGLWSVDQLTVEAISELVRRARAFRADHAHGIPSVKLLQGWTVALAFFEPSTRTRLSFQTALLRGGADVLDLDVARSSVQKGENIEETLATLSALAVDLVIVRTRDEDIAAYREALGGTPLINAGFGRREHPTQALGDVLTLYDAWGTLEGKVIGILGDIRHSRVAGSHLRLLPRLGARVVIGGPEDLLDRPHDPLSENIKRLPVDALVKEVDALIVLRLQKERLSEAILQRTREGDLAPQQYLQAYGLNERRWQTMRSERVVLHPGPVWPDGEIARSLLKEPSVLVRKQVTDGMWMRLALLTWLKEQWSCESAHSMSVDQAFKTLDPSLNMSV